MKSKICKVHVTEAVGLALAHDITEIVKGLKKGASFQKGHIVKETDIEYLKNLGKENLFVINIHPSEMHEDEAATILANALAGQNTEVVGPPREGKLNIIATVSGLLKVNKQSLYRLNLIGEVMCASLHDNTVVSRGQVVAATRAIPLVVSKKTIDKAVKVLSKGVKTLRVIPLTIPKAGIIITGNEVYNKRIEDQFAPVITKKVQDYGGEVLQTLYSPDDVDIIVSHLKTLVDKGVNIIFTTGGMSVDPDDVTRFAIKKFGATNIVYGSSVLPGAMFLTATYQTNGTTIPILAIPACGMYFKTTILDAVLPRVLAGEILTRADIASLAHGGLCLNCKECRYPVCPFCKA